MCLLNTPPNFVRAAFPYATKKMTKRRILAGLDLDAANKLIAKLFYQVLKRTSSQQSDYLFRRLFLQN